MMLFSTVNYNPRPPAGHQKLQFRITDSFSGCGVGCEAGLFSLKFNILGDVS